MANTERAEGVSTASTASAIGGPKDDQPPAVSGERLGQAATALPPDGHTAAADTTDLVNRLASHRTVGGAPREELEWLATHGRLLHYEAGETVATPSQPVSGMYVVLCGRVSIHVARGGARHKLAEWRTGDVTGLLPYSRLVAPPGETTVEEAADVLLVPRETLPAMTRECQELTSILVHVMLDRTRFFTSSFLHDEKLRSLGKLAAGLAHELNNPAAAIVRFAKVLPDALERAEAAAGALRAAALRPEEIEAARQVSGACLDTTVRHVESPLEEAERESVVAGWLEARGLDAGLADSLLQSPVGLEQIERLAGGVRSQVLEPVLRWVACDCAARRLAREIERAATRISGLVTAVRGFTRVDEAAAPQAVNVGEGLAQTVAVLAGKARSKGARVAIEVVEPLPPVRGVAAELNQVWANLIDNALDAAPELGRVDISARRDGGSVAVRITDNGPGIPGEILDRIFDPFFTTKDVGQGTGLGLDIVRRLVEQHDGDIEVHSQPGRTEFVVSLPVADNPEHGGEA